MEDDIALTSSLPRLTPMITSQLAKQAWDFVYFGYYGAGDVLFANRNTTESQIRFDLWTGNILSTVFYAVNGRILPRLITHLTMIANGKPGDRNSGPMPVDGAYNNFRRDNPDVLCLIAHPTLGWQTSSRSDISPRALDKLAFLRPAASSLRSLKAAFNLWRS
jgi:hypothetical protein